MGLKYASNYFNKIKDIQRRNKQTKLLEISYMWVKLDQVYQMINLKQSYKIILLNLDL